MLSLLGECRTLWRSRALLWVMTRREVAARHAGTAAGLLWPYVQPLLTVAAYWLVFDVVFSMRLGEGAPAHRVGAFLVVGALPWMAFCDATARGMHSLVEAGGILQKNALAPVLFPLRAVLASAVIFGPLLALVALVYWQAYGWHWSALALAGLLLGQLLLCAMLAYALAILTAALRDIGQMVAFLLSVGIYLSPILFPLALFPERWRWVLWLNPMTALVLGYQSVLLHGTWPPQSTWLALLAWLVLLAWLLDTLVRRSRDQLVDWL